jgi:hypothetical protein
MACSRCGVGNPDGKKYCGDCGAPLDPDFGPVREYLDSRLPDEVRAAIKEQLKDQKVLEIETSWAIASRVTDWMKVLAFVLAFPLAILGAFGVKSYFDVMVVMRDSQQAAEAMKKQIEQSKATADETQKQIDTSKATADTVQQDVSGLQAKARVVFDDLEGRRSEVESLRGTIATMVAQAQQRSADLESVTAQVDSIKEALSRTESAVARDKPLTLPDAAPPPGSTPGPVATSSAPTDPAARCPPVGPGDISGVSVDPAPVANCFAGRPFGEPLALSLHTLGGTYEQGRSFLTSPNAQGSIHFAVALDGRITQFVALKDRAWSDGGVGPGNPWDRICTSPCTRELRNPNNWIVSITTDDAGDPTTHVTEEQYRAVLEIGRQVLQRYPSIKWLVTPSDLGRAGNPGPRWVQSGRLANLARQLGLRTLE